MTEPAELTLSHTRAREAVTRLPPFSPVLTRVLSSLAKESTQISELADWIEKDTVLAGNVLRLVNSAAYGRLSTISSVRHAIAILGTNRLRNVVLSLSVCSMMNAVRLPAGWSNQQFNLHGIAVANMADRIVQSRPVEYAEGAFVTGLLHDVGKLLLAIASPAEYAEVLSSVSDPIGLEEAERARFGVSHAELSRDVLVHWKLPPPVQVAARYHHEPENAPARAVGAELSRVIQVADTIVNALAIPAIPGQSLELDPADVFAAAGLSAEAESIRRDWETEIEAIRAVV